VIPGPADLPPSLDPWSSLSCAKDPGLVEEREMDWKNIDRIRVPGFAEARRGYDKREVDTFLGRLADWLETDAANEIGNVAVTRKLEAVGRSTGHILLTTQQEAEALRQSADEECAKMLADAEATARRTREAAEAYARETRVKADADARSTVEAAELEARETVDEGERRRAQIEAVIATLEIRRDDVLADLDRTCEELAATIAGHRAPAEANPHNGEPRENKPAKRG
jgi:DivIVA domain-containing protein